MNAPAFISVIVSTYNRPDALAQVLHGCARQTDSAYEIIVADDGSGPATHEAVTRIAGEVSVRITHVWHPDEGFRLAAIRNRGIAAARGDYLIFLDGDCVPQCDFIARHRQLAQAGRMVTGSRILLGPTLTRAALDTPLDLQRQGTAFWITQRCRGQVNKIAPLWARLPASLPARRVDGFKWRGIKGCNLASWKNDVVAVNGFDETFSGWGHEDADFVARLHNHGIARTQGFWATEVLHLWHAEQPRTREQHNRDKVRERLVARTVRATRGLDANAR